MRLALITVLLTCCLNATPVLTQIQDTLYKADGSRFDGYALVEWKSFRAADGSEVPQQAINVRVAGGSLRVALIPSTNAQVPFAYTIRFNSEGRTQFVEYWSVPPSATSLRLKDVRITPQPTSTGGTTFIKITDIMGLRAELDSRPVKSGAISSSRAAVITSEGAIEAAAGGPNDCLRVDGTSGPCGGPAIAPILFVDGETPAGAVNGSNRIYTLQFAPIPALSLHVFRNGLLQKVGVDYTVAGSQVSFLPVATPQTGDLLQVSYRH